MAVFLGVDIGTTSAKCLAVAEDGRTPAFAQRPYPMAHPEEGWAEQDPEHYLEALAAVVGSCVAECAARGLPATEIRALALSTQADTLIVADEDGSALRPAVSWMARAPEECRCLLDEYGEGFWQANTGQPLTPFSSACKIRRLQRVEPDLMGSRPRIAYVPDFLARRLAGRWVTDLPSASWSPFGDPATRGPSVAAMDAVGVTAEQLSPAVESCEPIGELMPEVCDRLGLARGTLLVAGAFDQTAAAYGAGATAGGACVLSCGTAWVLYAVADHPPRAGDSAPCALCACCHARPDAWGLVLPFTGGSAYDWVTRTVVAGSEPSDASPLIFVPHLYGGLSPDWQEQSKGSLLGLTLSHTAEDIRLALMRGLAFETRRNIEAAEPHAGRPASLRMVGGATHSDIWPQIIADVTDLRVEVPALTEAACYGAAMLAAGHGSAEPPDWPPEKLGAVQVFEPARDSALDLQYEAYMGAYAWLTRHYRGESAPTPAR